MLNETGELQNICEWQTIGNDWQKIPYKWWWQIMVLNTQWENRKWRMTDKGAENLDWRLNSVSAKTYPVLMPHTI